MDVYFEINIKDSTITCSLSVPDQFIKNTPASKASYIEDSLQFSYSQFRASFSGIYKAESDEIHGVWRQGAETPLVLSRSNGIAPLSRPQEPKAPFPYTSEEVIFTNAVDEIKLAGTLTLPKGEGPFPAVVLISGSGPQNRNSEIMSHKPFLVISDHLTRNGIAVLRYDDRGVDKSGGNFTTATTMDLSNDALAAFNFLNSRKEIRKEAIGLIGHSEGGMIAPVVANNQEEVGFLILLAGPAENIVDMMVKQNSNIFKTYGFTEEELLENEKYNSKLFSLVASDKASEELYDTIQNLSKSYYNSLDPKHRPLFGPSPEVYYISLAGQIFSPWFRGFISFNAREYLVNITCPVLALNGIEDIQVPYKSNLDAIDAGLEEAGNEDFTTKELEGLNHLFQKCETCSVQEYGKIKETFSPIVLELMTNWINKRFR
jgi:alpha/beta superfamily hydrolase